MGPGPQGCCTHVCGSRSACGSGNHVPILKPDLPCPWRRSCSRSVAPVQLPPSGFLRVPLLRIRRPRETQARNWEPVLSQANNPECT